ncbi:MAG: MBL fold metallo-hydrolase [Candidatus Micrarchaeia archaeon]
MFEKIKWIGHASFCIETNGIVVYIDPFRISEQIAKEKADLILVTHAHFDHFSKEDIGKIKKPDTVIITSTQTLPEGKNVKVAKPGFRTNFNGIEIEAVPAYNIKKERLGFHPKSNEWVGYVIGTEFGKVYHAGDTDHIPEMKSLKNIELALLPIGGTYTMDVKEAIEATKSIEARYFAPMHYKNLLGLDGSKNAEEEFKKNVKNAVIFSEVQKPTYSF